MINKRHKILKNVQKLVLEAQLLSPDRDMRQQVLGAIQTELWQRFGPWLKPVLSPEPAPVLPFEPFIRAISELSLPEALEILGHITEWTQALGIRKSSGVYYTPPQLAYQMVEKAFSYAPFQWDQPQAILDPAAGSGCFLWQSAWFLIEQARQSQAPLEQQHQHLFDWFEQLHACDIDASSLQVLQFGLTLIWHSYFPDRPAPQAQLWCQDALAAETQLSIRQHWPDLSPGWILANPPYVGEKNNSSRFQPLQHGFWKLHYRARGDLYYYFYYLALELMQAQTIAVFLTPSYFYSASEALYLRQRLDQETQILEIIDYQEQKLFSAAPGLHSQLIFFKLASAEAVDRVRVSRLEIGSDLIHQQERQQSALFHGQERILSWGTSLMLEQALQKMQGQPLSERYRINQGIVTGADRLSKRWASDLQQTAGSSIFVLSAAEAAPYLADPDCQAYLRPWFKNSQIQAWQAHTDPRAYVIYSDRQTQSLPARLLAHLKPFQACLEQRREVQQGMIAWWQLQWPRQAHLFESPKLVLPQRARHCLAAYTAQHWYASADVYFISGASEADLYVLLALLNSTVYTCWLWHQGKRKGQLLELYQRPLSQLPFPDLSAPAYQRLLLFTRQQIANPEQNPNWRHELHQICADLFQFSAAEAQSVWNFSQSRTRD